MFIQNLQIDRFGSVSNLAFNNLTGGVTVIQGGPGTGKTTLLQFARAILYGFDESTRSQYLPAISSDEFGGSITWLRGHRQYTIRRHDDGKFNGHCEVLGDGHPSSRVALTDTLQGISADLYARLFAVDFSHRPDVSGLLTEASNCGFAIEGRPIDTVKLQELKRRLATFQANLATLGAVDQSTDSLHLRRRELLDDIARLELDAAKCQAEQSQTQGQIDAIQGQQETARQELQALRRAIEEITAARHDGRSRLAKAEAAAANSRSHTTEIRELDAQIERWQNVLCEAASRYEALGRREPVAATPHPHSDEFEANLVALDTYLCELELTATPDRVGIQPWEKAEVSPKLSAMRERLKRLRSHMSWQAQASPPSGCDCERKQLTRAQAELQVSLRYLEAERDALVANSRPSKELTDEVIRLKQQLEQFDAKEVELQRRFDTVTLLLGQKEIELSSLLQRLHALTNDLAERLSRNREKLHHVEYLLNEVERRQTLLESIKETQRQIRYTEDGGGESSIMRGATSYLRQISADGLQRIEVTHGKHVWVTDTKGHRLSWGHLSEGVRDKVYLSLCLAIVEAHDLRNAPLPLIWKDVFTHFDSRQVPETAELLCNFARDGRQLLLLTRHEHVANVFRLMNVPSRHLVAPHDSQAKVGVGDDRLAIHDVNHLLTVAGDAELTEIDPAWEPDEPSAADGEFYLYEDSPIEHSPSLGSDHCVRLRRLGITTVGDLLDARTNEIAAELSYAGITSSMVADWQAQALMMCGVARLREYDARILVACGITNPTQLRKIPPVEVRSMIERFAHSSEGRAMLLSGTEFELSRVTNWVRTEEAVNGPRQAGSRGMASAGTRASSPPATGDRASFRSSSDRVSSGSVNRSAGQAGNRLPQASGSGGAAGREVRDSRTERQSERQSERRTGGPAKQHDQQRADVVKMKPAAEVEALQFYLDSDAGVVDAPSIGPRSAEQLEALGVVTVSDFLAVDPEETARRLKNKRMSANLIRQWQQQTELVCRVPRLRGHDAQILVAVGVTEVDELASMDPQELWALVEPFVDSTAGKRIIRSSKAPDFEEVFHWIEWAGQARALKAA